MKLNESAVSAIASGLKASGPATYLGGVIYGVPWGPIASMLAAVWSAIVIGEWVWKKIKAFRAKQATSG